MVRTADDSTFAAILERYRRQLHVHCYRMLGSVEDADDVVQDTFLGAWRGRRRFEGRSSFRTWLYRIATNACLRTLSRSPLGTIGAYLLIGPYITLGWIAKGIELAIIGLVAVDLLVD